MFSSRVFYIKYQSQIWKVSSPAKYIQFSKTTQDERHVKTTGVCLGWGGGGEEPDIFHWLTKLHILLVHTVRSHGPSMIFTTTSQVKADGKYELFKNIEVMPPNGSHYNFGEIGNEKCKE